MSQAAQPREAGPHRPEVGEPRYDVQGDLSEQERVDRAVANFVKDIGAVTATHLDACIHCGQCAEACHFYRETGDPKYTPVYKLEPFRRAYQREMSPFAFLRRWSCLSTASCTSCHCRRTGAMRTGSTMSRMSSRLV